MGICARGHGQVIIPSVNSGLSFGGWGPRGFLFDVGSMSRVVMLYGNLKSSVECFGMNLGLHRCKTLEGVLCYGRVKYYGGGRGGWSGNGDKVQVY